MIFIYLKEKYVFVLCKYFRPWSDAVSDLGHSSVYLCPINGALGVNGLRSAPLLPLIYYLPFQNVSHLLYSVIPPLFHSPSHRRYQEHLRISKSFFYDIFSPVLHLLYKPMYRIDRQVPKVDAL